MSRETSNDKNIRNRLTQPIFHWRSASLTSQTSCNWLWTRPIFFGRHWLSFNSNSTYQIKQKISWIIQSIVLLVRQLRFFVSSSLFLTESLISIELVRHLYFSVTHWFRLNDCFSTLTEKREILENCDNDRLKQIVVELCSSDKIDEETNDGLICWDSWPINSVITLVKELASSNSVLKIREKWINKSTCFSKSFFLLRRLCCRLCVFVCLKLAIEWQKLFSIWKRVMDKSFMWKKTCSQNGATQDRFLSVYCFTRPYYSTFECLCSLLIVYPENEISKDAIPLDNVDSATLKKVRSLS